MSIILIPIQVSDGDYCYGGDDMSICEHFDNEGGYLNCRLSSVLNDSGKQTYDHLSRDTNGRVKKLPKCLTYKLEIS